MSNYRYIIFVSIGCAIALSNTSISFAQTIFNPIKTPNIQNNYFQTNSSPAMMQFPNAITVKDTTSNNLSNPSKNVELTQSSSPSPVLPDKTLVPKSLDPNPNPLQLPTKPEEVKIQDTQAISLQQALELARRNNRELQVTILTLERSRAALREVQAGLYPNLSLNTDISRQQSANGQLSAELGSRSGVLFTESAPDATLSGAAQLSYNIYTSGLRSARIRTAEEQLRFDELDVESKVVLVRGSMCCDRKLT